MRKNDLAKLQKYNSINIEEKEDEEEDRMSVEDCVKVILLAADKKARKVLL